MFEKKIPDGFLNQHVGRQFEADGFTWVLDSWNDLNVPYFHKLGQKKLFCVTDAAGQLVKEARNT